ncbi:MAG TPA: hypothetical protein VIT65_15750 [Microlunatus sp.]
MTTSPLAPHPDRLFPPDPGVRWLAAASSVARLVTEHRPDEDEAYEVVHELVDTSPRRAFEL